MFGSGTTRASPELHRAARRGDVAAVDRLLASEDVNQRDANGSTALMWASQYGRDATVRRLLGAPGADATARNRFGWSALEYASTSAFAGNVLPILLDAPGVRRGARVAVPPEILLADAASSSSSSSSSPSSPPPPFARLICDHEPGAFRATTAAKSVGVGRWESLAVNAVERYASGAATSARDLLETSDDIRVGGVAIAGCTCKPLGLYAGQRYEVRDLFWRRRGGRDVRDPDEVFLSDADFERAERRRRAPARRATEPPPPNGSDGSDGSDFFGANGANGANVKKPTREKSVEAREEEHAFSDWELVAELSNPTWTPWGSVEVGVVFAELRTVRAELGWSARVAASASAFWLCAGTLLSGDVASLAAVPSESMAPGIRKGDVMLVDRRSGARESATVGDVVLFAPPPALVDAATRAAGVAPGRGDFFVKRIVAVEGDRIEIVDGALIRNGRRERPYPTGTPVGVVTSEEEDARERRRTDPSDALTAVCGSTCKPGRYDLAPTTVPRGVVLVLGDNRGASNDGHVWGYLPREYVLGKTAVRVGPWARGGALETEARAPPRE